MRSTIWNLARVGLAIGILALLLNEQLLELRLLGRLADAPLVVVAALMLLAAAYPLSAMRWHRLLRAAGHPADFMWALRTVTIGQFVSTFLPGGYGGDMVRAALAYGVTRSGMSAIAISILVDRIAGLAGLLLLGAIPLLLLPEPLRPSVSGFLLLVLVVLSAVVLAVGLGRNIARVAGVFPRRVAERSRAIAESLANAIVAYRGEKRIIMLAIALSVVQFLGILTALYLVGSALQMSQLGISGYALAGVTSILANALPLTPGGIGIGEAAFAKVAMYLQPIDKGLTAYASAFLGMRALTILVSLMGVVPFIISRKQIVALRRPS
jgi:uncharacterized protein (TIRG00374 family)